MIGRGRAPSRTWEDADLVRACLDGDERAWAALIDKYQRLVYSVPRRYRLQPDAAADVFQCVWLELYKELPKLKHAGSLRSWLLTVASHQAFHKKRGDVKRAEREGGDLDGAGEAAAAVPPEPDWLELTEREQVLRDAIARLSARCQEMIRLLFFEEPPTPYAEVAARLGLAVGSIGFIRGRCLQRLQRMLDDGGL